MRGTSATWAGMSIYMYLCYSGPPFTQLPPRATADDPLTRHPQEYQEGKRPSHILSSAMITFVCRRRKGKLLCAKDNTRRRRERSTCEDV